MKGSVVCPPKDLSLRRVVMGLQLEGRGGERKMGQRAVARSRTRQAWEELMLLGGLAPKLRQSFEEEGKARLLIRM